MHSSETAKRYLMAVQVQYVPLANSEIQIESAYWNHIVMLKDSLAKNGYKLELGLVPLSAEEIKGRSASLSKVDPQSHGITVHSVFPDDLAKSSSKLKKLTKLIPACIKVYKLVLKIDVLHTGMSADSFMPTSFFALFSAIITKKKLVYVVDIDFRDIGFQLYKSGEWNRKTFILNSLLYDKFKQLQLRIGANFADLCLLKGKAFANSYEHKGKNVRYFLDTVHTQDQVIGVADLDEVVAIRARNNNLNLVYFGRIEKYKGIQDIVEVIYRLTDKGITNLHLTIIGDGTYKTDLEILVATHQLEDYVSFSMAVPYGEQLFSKIKIHDVLVALPQRQDTPRSAFDAMVMGLPILAYDIDYYKELCESSAILTTPWLDSESLEISIKQLCENKSKLLGMAYHARRFALENTQESWVGRRTEWTVEAIDI